MGLDDLPSACIVLDAFSRRIVGWAVFFVLSMSIFSDVLAISI